MESILFIWSCPAAAGLKAWMGKAENVGAAQMALLKRAKLNGLATMGEYSSEME